MKKLFYIFIIFFIFSCELSYTPQPVINYKGSKVYDKKKTALNEKCNNAKCKFTLTLSYEYNTKTHKYRTQDVDVYKIDWDKYNIGDTIK